MVQARFPGSTRPARRWLAGSVLAVAAVAWMPADAHNHGGRGMHAGPSAGAMMLFNGPPERIARGIDRLLEGLGTTDAQRSQITQIAQGAAADMKAQRDSGAGLREKGLQALVAPTIDAAAAESLRQQMVAQHDLASKRMLQAVLDIGKVLTPEQRARLGERMQQRQAMMRERMQRGERSEQPRP